ncbi:MAG: phosphoenolpyruvate carboxykinase (ATP), partial [Firmicutes bacterium]|nr:phosphoenolpyruvate carboxykinase (ATP) [Bacillota bacterium]
EGAFCALTGQFTGRSPKDKYIVRDTYSANRVHWGPVNQPMDPQHFARLYDRVLRYIETASRPTFVGVGFARAGATHLPIRVVTERAWHNLFAKQLFLRPDETDNPEDKGPAGLAEFTI